MISFYEEDLKEVLASAFTKGAEAFLQAREITSNNDELAKEYERRFYSFIENLERSWSNENQRGAAEGSGNYSLGN